MTRILTAACTALVVLCLFQWRVTRDLKTELATEDARARQAALVDLAGRRDEVLRVVTWIGASSRATSPGTPRMEFAGTAFQTSTGLGNGFSIPTCSRARGERPRSTRVSGCSNVMRSGSR